MLDELILAVAVSIDTFIMAISCGMDCIKIPFKSSLGVGIVGAIVMVISILLSGIVCQYIPNKMCNILCCAVLCAMGGMNIIRHMIERHKKLKSIQFLDDDKPSIIDVYLYGSYADCDKSKEISIKEAIVVSFLMSLDTVVTGVAGGNSLNVVFLGVSTLIIQSVTVWLGSIIGMKSAKFPDVSLVGGLLLIILGISKIV